MQSLIEKKEYDVLTNLNLEVIESILLLPETMAHEIFNIISIPDETTFPQIKNAKLTRKCPIYHIDDFTQLELDVTKRATARKKLFDKESGRPVRVYRTLIRDHLAGSVKSMKLMT